MNLFHPFLILVRLVFEINFEHQNNRITMSNSENRSWSGSDNGSQISQTASEQKSNDGANSKSESNTSSTTKIIFQDGETVLCYHGPLLYEAKV